MNNNTFCILPFIEYFRKNDTHRLCCVGPTVDFTKSNDNDIMGFMNSPEMVEIRRKIYNGEKVEFCNNCYKEEDASGRSKRTDRNQIHEAQYQQYVEEVAKNDFKIPHITRVNYRPSTLCNLQCKMCGPWSSSQIEKDEKKILEEYGPDYFKHSNRPFPEFKEDSDITDDIIEILPTMEFLEFAGGEPTLIKDVATILQKCNDMDVAKNIHLKMPINLTNVTDEFLRLTKSFRRVELVCSLDGVGPINDYIRYPSNWNTIEKNFNKLLTETDYEVKFLHTIQNLNVHLVASFVKWALDTISKYPESRFPYRPVYFNYVHSPKYLNCTNMPSRLILDALGAVEHANHIVDNYDATDEIKSNVRMHLDKLQGILEHSSTFNEDLEKQLKFYIKFQDQRKNQDIRTINPLLGHWIYD